MITQSAVQLRHVGSLAGKGERPEQFLVRLAGVAVDADGGVWVGGDREVKRFTRKGALDLRIPLDDAPWCVTAVGNSVWIGMQGAIARLNRASNALETIRDPRLGRITSLAIAADVLFAADASHNTIHLFKGGAWVKEVGQDANTRGFMIPNGVLDLDYDSAGGMVLVAHSQKHRVERYSLDGKFVDSFGRFGVEDPAGFGGCCNPTNVAVLAEDLIATSVKAPAEVKLYTSGGEFLGRIGAGIFDPNTKNIDLATDGRGRLYATDPLRCVVEIFQWQTT